MNENRLKIKAINVMMDNTQLKENCKILSRWLWASLILNAILLVLLTFQGCK